LYDGRVPARSKGEVHVALVCKPGNDPVVRMNFFAPDWFHSDSETLAALDVLFQDWPRERFDGVRRMCERNHSPRRTINFLGVDEDSATVYLNVDRQA
jgi:hypothetical protein